MFLIMSFILRPPFYLDVLSTSAFCGATGACTAEHRITSSYYSISLKKKQVIFGNISKLSVFPIEFQERIGVFAAFFCRRGDFYFDREIYKHFIKS